MTKSPRKQLLPTWVSVVGIVVILLGIAAFFLVQASIEEDRRTCRVLQEAYPDEVSDC